MVTGKRMSNGSKFVRRLPSQMTLIARAMQSRMDSRGTDAKSMDSSQVPVRAAYNPAASMPIRTIYNPSWIGGGLDARRALSVTKSAGGGTQSLVDWMWGSLSALDIMEKAQSDHQASALPTFP